MMQNDKSIQSPKIIFALCFVYSIHMVEEFMFGFVEWADKYFGHFDWTQNIIGNTAYMILLIFACAMYVKDPIKYLWLGMAGAMWALSNAFIHLSATVLGAEYSPGVVTASVFYIPVTVYFLGHWLRQRQFNWKNCFISFFVGGFLLMLFPTFVRSIIFNAKLAQLFHLV